MICPKDSQKDWDDLLCRDCEWYFTCFKMWQDNNIWGKEDEPIGDNFPKINKELPSFIVNGICDKDRPAPCQFYPCINCSYNPDNQKNANKELNTQQQEILNSIRMIGDGATWEMVEAIKDVRLRLRYRLIFIKLGGKIPEKEI
jgi:hypothetical protein